MFRIGKSLRRRRTWGSLFAVLLLFLLLGTSHAKDGVPRNLLILHSYHPSLTWTEAVMKGMREALIQGGGPVQIHVDYLDARRYSGPEYRQKMESLLLHKLGNAHFDLVMLSDNDALDFFLNHRKRIAPEAPVIFCGINNFTESTIAGQKRITGVAEEVSLQETIDTALKLHFGTKEIFVIGRTDLPADRANRDAFVSLLQSFRYSVKFTFWDNLSANELRKRLPSIQDGAIVFINGLTSDETGRQLLYDETTRLIRESTKVPLYSLWDVYLGHGIVGGKLVSGYLQGKVAGELAVRVLRGEDPDQIPVVRKDTANKFMFDYHELSRFGLSVSSVPVGSEIINSPPSFYVINKAFIWGGGVSLLIFSGIIALLWMNILARKKAEAALRESEAKYAAVVEHAKDGVLIIQDNILRFVNQALADILGYTPGEIENMPYINFVAPESRPIVAARVKSRLAGEEVPPVYEAKLLGRDGNIIDAELSANVIQYRGKPADVGIIRDITERKRAQEALRKSEERMRLFFERQLVGMAITSPEKGWLQVNDEICRMLGYRREELAHLTWAELTYPEDLEADVAQFNRLLAGEIAEYSLEKRFVRKDETIVYTNLSVGCVRRPNGSVDYVLALVEDITERKRAEEKLRESERRFSVFMEHLPAAVFIKDPSGRLLYANRYLQETFGWKQFLGKTTEELLPREMAERMIADDRRVLTEGLAVIQERIIDIHGVEHFFATYKFPIPAEGASVLLGGIAVELTERIKAEKELANTKILLQSAFEQTPVPMVLVRAPDAVFLNVNRACVEMLGVADEGDPREQSLVGFDQTWQDFDAEGRRVPRTELPLALALQGVTTRNRELSVLRKDGTRRWEIVNAAPIFNEAGEMIAAFAVFPDITEQKRAEEALRESEAKYRRLHETMMDAFVSVDMTGRMQEANRAYQAMLGYSEEELRQLTYMDLTPEKWHAFERSMIEEQIMVQGHSEVYEKEYRRKDGAVFPVELRTFLMRDDAGKPVGMWAIVRDITERKQAEEALRESEEKFRNLVETTSDWIWETDARGDYSYASPKVRDLLGYEPGEVIGRKPFDFMPPDEAERLAAEFARTTAEHRPFFNLENVNLRKDGNQVTLETSGVPRLDPQGNFLGYRGIDRDITERKRAEEALRESAEQYRIITNTTLDGFAVVDLGGHLLDVNEAYCHMVGYSRDELLKMSVPDIEAIESPGRIEARLKKIIEKGSDRFESRHRRKDGHIVDVEISLTFMRQSDRFLAFLRDITETKWAEEALRKSEKDYRSVIENIQDVFYRSDRNGRLIMGSPSAAKMFGYDSLDQMIGMPLDSFWPDPKERERLLAQIKATGRVRDYEAVIKRKDGTTFHASFTTHFYYDDRGNLLGTEGIIRDITDRKRAEEALRQSEEKYRLIAENTADVISINDMNLRFTYVSPSIMRLRGFTVEEAREQTLDQVMTPESLKIALSAFKEEMELEASGNVEPERIRTMDLEEYRKDGSILWVEASLSFLRDKDHKPVAILAITRDITDRKRAEEELRMAQMVLEARVRERTADLVKINKELQTEILERKHTEESLKRAKEGAEAASIAKSAFLANMSHEVRTPLNAIIGFSELMADGQAGELNETQKEYLTDVLQSGHHLLSLINDILDLSKVEAGKMDLELKELSLRALVERSFAMVREKALKQGIEISEELNGIPDPIEADERKLKQVLFNLVSNAVKFSPDGGRVGVRGDSILKRNGSWFKEDGRSLDCPIPMEIETADGRPWALISVEDTGIGIEKGNLERIFAPFEQVDCTASRRFQGTGLGLALTRRFVELHGGKVWAESRGLGKGSAFRFLIPISQLKEEDGRS